MIWVGRHYQQYGHHVSRPASRLGAPCRNVILHVLPPGTAIPCEAAPPQCGGRWDTTAPCRKYCSPSACEHLVLRSRLGGVDDVLPRVVAISKPWAVVWVATRGRPSGRGGGPLLPTGLRRGGNMGRVFEVPHDLLRLLVMVARAGGSMPAEADRLAGEIAARIPSANRPQRPDGPKRKLRRASMPRQGWELPELAGHYGPAPIGAPEPSASRSPPAPGRDNDQHTHHRSTPATRSSTGRGLPSPRPRLPATVGNDPGNSIRFRIA
ncbi:DUF6417 family protein [Streptomyces sp. NPDC005708]|uniref:DUF6417 family protein n=1 Tax=Streptomyces sp. NPDC005708 TaxID=3154564 RepID=UPI0033D25F2C